jgi:hypothetical protein
LPLLPGPTECQQLSSFSSLFPPFFYGLSRPSTGLSLSPIFHKHHLPQGLEVLSVAAIVVLSYPYTKKAPGILYLTLLLSTKLIAKNSHICSTTTHFASISPATRHRLHHGQYTIIKTLFPGKVNDLKIGPNDYFIKKPRYDVFLGTGIAWDL